MRVREWEIAMVLYLDIRVGRLVWLSGRAEDRKTADFRYTAMQFGETTGWI
jgi:hypothetical protein